MTQTPYQRVTKQMTQMFGPQWTEKWGTRNEAWEEALKGLTYSQISAGLSKVLRSGLKFYEIDLPRFMELCKPPRAPMSLGEIPRMKWTEGMCEKELQMHFYANQRMMVWCWRHPKWGINGTSTVQMPKEMSDKIWAETRRIAHDFFMMREEMGDENVPQEDFLKALEQHWSRIVT